MPHFQDVMYPHGCSCVIWFSLMLFCMFQDIHWFLERKDKVILLHKTNTSGVIYISVELHETFSS